jgi:phosphoserine phosphatase RsbU/P
MKVLIAEDDAISRRLLQSCLTGWGFEVIVTTNGVEALKALESDQSIQFAILDWMMPDLEGIEVCRQIRQRTRPSYIYLIILTSLTGKADVVAGLEAGADDYFTKPFNIKELKARVHVAVRMLDVQNALADNIKKLQDALANVKHLQGLLPICSYCKRIRNDQNYWQQVEAYVSEHTDAQFSHSICPDCYDAKVKPELDSLDFNDLLERKTA